MEVANENIMDTGVVFENGERTFTAQSDSVRVDFRHASSHLSQKRPGYYLILLRNELRHRSLRDKPTLTG